VIVASVTTTVSSGSFLLALPIALAAGLLSFASPCVLPLVPGYVSFLSGAVGAEAAASADKKVSARTILGAVAFVLGFAVIYVSFGALFGGLGATLKSHQRILEIVFGAITVVLGLFFAGLLPGASMLNREVRVHWLPRATIIGAFLLGLFFGLGWTPCIGPTLGAILGLAASSSGTSALRGSLLALIYCLGLGIPFIVAAVAVEKIGAFSRFVRRHAVVIMRIGGIALVVVGLLEVTGIWSSIITSIQDHFSSFSVPL
jgi:cytochrome c-type biogenesis protein